MQLFLLRFYKPLFATSIRTSIKSYLSQILFIRHNLRLWRSATPVKPTGEILLEPFNQPDWLISAAYFCNTLAKKSNSRIASFHQPTILGYLKFFFSPNTHIRFSFNVNKFIFIRLNRSQKAKLNIIKNEFKMGVKTKKALLHYCIDGINIGEDIYETYLKSGNPTVSFADKQLWSIAHEAFSHYLFWHDYLRVNNVQAVVISHDCYILSNVPAKIAYKYNIPVYLPSPRSLARSDYPHSLYKNRFLGYKSDFLKLPQHIQDSAVLFAKSRLELRLGGEVGVDMTYSTASAFSQTFSNQPLLVQSQRPKVVIYTHCFYDNPHAYGDMIFPDFLEWLYYLGNISLKTDYDWYIKCHPDALPGTADVIHDYVSKYTNIKLLPNTSSTHQLVAEGLTAALTCYGSIGHELPLLNVSVINAGLNPHISHSFNIHPKTLDEYSNAIYGISALYHNMPRIDYNEIYKFYYMHYAHYYIDSLIFASHKHAEEVAIKNNNPHAFYQHYIDTFNPTKHCEAINVINQYLESSIPLLDATLYQEYIANITDQVLAETSHLFLSD